MEKIEYEGLHVVCFHYGYYRHITESCTKNIAKLKTTIAAYGEAAQSHRVADKTIVIANSCEAKVAWTSRVRLVSPRNMENKTNRSQMKVGEDNFGP